MINAALDGDMRTVKRLQIELSVAVARKKFSKAADSAMRTFLDFIDPRKGGTAAYCARAGLGGPGPPGFVNTREPSPGNPG